MYMKITRNIYIYNFQSKRKIKKDNKQKSTKTFSLFNKILIYNKN